MTTHQTDKKIAKKLALTQRIEEFFKHILATFPVLNYGWGVFQAIGGIYLSFSDLMKIWLEALGEILEPVAISMESYLFYKDKEKNLEKFFNQLVIPSILLVLSSLLSFAIIGATTIFGIFVGAARLVIETINRGISLFKLLKAGWRQNQPIQQDKFVQEEIYADLVPMQSILASAFIALGGIGLSLGSAGIGLIVPASIYLGGALVYKTISHFFPEAFPTLNKWLRRHEPIFIKKK